MSSSANELAEDLLRALRSDMRPSGGELGAWLFGQDDIGRVLDLADRLEQDPDSMSENEMAEVAALNRELIDWTVYCHAHPGAPLDFPRWRARSDETEG